MPLRRDLVRRLFAPLVEGWPVALEEMDPREAPPDLSLLHPSEARDISARAVDARRRERVAGRLLARRALARLGVVAPVPAGENRAPRWPPGGLHWEALDEDISVPALLSDVPRLAAE